jgi:hypothetical protein
MEPRFRGSTSHLKATRGSIAVPHPEPVRSPLFGRAPGEAARGAAHGALPNRSQVY